MKKILLSTVVLIAFSLSIILFQLSCKKIANAQSSSYSLPPATTSKLGGVIPDGTTISVDANGKISAISSGSSAAQENKILYTTYDSQPADTKLWSANYDGSNPQQINLSLPVNFTLAGSVKISPDHKTIFLILSNTSASAPVNYIYACNIDGSNLHKVIAANSSIEVVY